MEKIAIIGPGAIGATVAAHLGQTGRYEIVVCARSKLDRIEIETPDGTFTTTPRVITAPAQESPAAWILVTTKTYDARAAALWLPSLTGPTTRLAVLQNGIEHVERFAPFFDPSRILPVVVDCPAERIAPGKVRQRRMGHMTVTDSPMGNAFSALFAGTRIEVRKTNDFVTAAWAKLCINSAGAVNALTLKPARIVHLQEAADLMRGVVRECIAVGRADGADLPDSLVEAVIEGYRNAAPDSINSLHSDRLEKRPMESDARNGVIVLRGAKHGISTPINRTIVALLKAIEAP